MDLQHSLSPEETNNKPMSRVRMIPQKTTQYDQYYWVLTVDTNAQYQYQYDHQHSKMCCCSARAGLDMGSKVLT